MIAKTPEWLKKYPASILPIFASLFYFIFPAKFIDIITAILVKPVIDSVAHSNWITDTILCIASVYTLLRFSSAAKNNKKLSFVENTFIICYSLLYIFIKLFKPETFTYTPMFLPILRHLALLDTTLAPLLGLGYYTLFQMVKKSAEPNNTEKAGFYIDTPILLSENNDPFNRRKHVGDLAKTIISTNQIHNSFAIGISGKWGSGKTTFIKSIYEQLKSEKSIIQIEFNAWTNSSNEGLVGSLSKNLSLATGTRTSGCSTALATSTSPSSTAS